MNRFLDLSMSLNNQTPVYLGDPIVIISPVAHIDKDGLSMHSYQFGGHTATHIDAASHFILGGKNLGDYPPEKFTGMGEVIDARGRQVVDYDILRNIKVSKNQIVLFWTDYSKKEHEEGYFQNYPVLTKKLAEALIKLKVKIIGMDAPSFDTEPDFPVHKILLASDILLLEGLTNLDLVYKKRFKVYAFPLKVETDGVPVRVVGEIY